MFYLFITIYILFKLYMIVILTLELNLYLRLAALYNPQRLLLKSSSGFSDDQERTSYLVAENIKLLLHKISKVLYRYIKKKTMYYQSLLAKKKDTILPSLVGYIFGTFYNCSKDCLHFCYLLYSFSSSAL